MNLSVFDIINIIKFILFVFNFLNCLINCLIPLFYILRCNYKICKLKDKNISANINHKERKCFIHFLNSIHSSLICIVLIYDFVIYYLNLG
ncbi:hypothetical protein, partial [Candidatus Phytoplasma sp. AldY-WA1]|uniref:hypothetical protein n=1 Tax=Candidatus Phytoplasma sp. AldY-WA1 TaxID=2852100 RepID=UPI00254C2A77